MKKSINQPEVFSVSLLIFILLTAGGCGYLSENENTSDASGLRKGDRTPDVKVWTIEEDIAAMRSAGIGNIFVIRKSDDSVFNSEDKDFLRANMPLEINRVLSSDAGKAFIVGSTYIIPTDNISAWKTRFKVQEMSEKKKK
jgi:hypothetical protein